MVGDYYSFILRVKEACFKQLTSRSFFVSSRGSANSFPLAFLEKVEGFYHKSTKSFLNHFSSFTANFTAKFPKGI